MVPPPFQVHPRKHVKVSNNADIESTPTNSNSTDASDRKTVIPSTIQDGPSAEISPAEDDIAPKFEPTLSYRLTGKKNSFQDIKVFLFTAEELGKLHDPKDLKALDKLGGLMGWLMDYGRIL